MLDIKLLMIKCCRRPAPSRPEDDDHEEEFYYNEIDIPLHTSQPQQHKPVSLCKPPPAHVAADKTLVISPSSKIPTGGRSQAPIISDHMDMARPPHENPEYGGARAILPANSPAYATIISSNGTPLQWSPEGQVVPLTPETAQAQATNLTTTNNPSSAAAAAATLPAPPCPTGHGPAAPPAPMHAVPIAIPITTFTIASSQHVSITLARILCGVTMVQRIPHQNCLYASCYYDISNKWSYCLSLAFELLQ